MSTRIKTRIGKISVDERIKHKIPSNTKNLFIDLYDVYKEAKKGFTDIKRHRVKNGFRV